MRKTLLLVSLLAFGVCDLVECANSVTRSAKNKSHHFTASTNYRYLKMDALSDTIARQSPFNDFEEYNASSSAKSISLAGALSYAYQGSNWRAGIAGQYEHSSTQKAYFDQRIRFRAPWIPRMTILRNTYREYQKFSNAAVGLTLFADAELPYGLYVDGLVHIGFNSSKMKVYDWQEDAQYSAVAYNTGEASETYNTVAAGVRLGRQFVFGDDWRLTPFAGFDYAYKPSETYNFPMYYRERGTYYFFSYTFSARRRTPDQNIYEVPIGIKLAKDFRVGSCWTISPFVEAAMVNSIGRVEMIDGDLEHGNKQSYPGFSVYNGSEWRTYGMAGDHFGGRIKVGLAARMNDRLDFGLSYSFEGRDKLQEHKVAASFGLAF